MTVSNSDQQPKMIQSTDTPYVKGGRFLVIPADLKQNFTPWAATVDALDGSQAWLSREQTELGFPKGEEWLLIEFQDEFVLTHRTRVTERKGNRVLVAAPSLTDKEESQLAPTTGRHDYRVQLSIPLQMRFVENQARNLVRSATLWDLSRGGLNFITDDRDVYQEGDQLNLQVVSWEYPVNIDAVVSRILDHNDQQKVAVRFKDGLGVRQREMISAFIIQAQRQDALSRSLPSEC